MLLRAAQLLKRLGGAPSSLCNPLQALCPSLQAAPPSHSPIDADAAAPGPPSSSHCPAPEHAPSQLSHLAESTACSSNPTPIPSRSPCPSSSSTTEHRPWPHHLHPSLNLSVALLPASRPQSDDQHAACSSRFSAFGSVNTRSYARGHRDVHRNTHPLPPNIKAIVDEKFQAWREEKLPEPVAPPLVARKPQTHSRRVGCIAVKAGMTQEWDEWGARVPLTVLFIDDCQVVGIKSMERNGYRALQVGASYAKQKSLSPAATGFFIAQGVPFKKKVVDFQVSGDAVLPVGTHITAAHWVAGQNVDVTGYTKDKGFAGVMKRHGFKGLGASHGVTLKHRSGGSIGCRTDPGRVWKGKKMAGHMGNERDTQHNLTVYKVDPQRHLVYVRGQVPGPKGAFVFLRDALNVSYERRILWGAPFPTCLEDPAQMPVSVWKNEKDPYRMFREDTDYFPVKWKKTD